MRILWLSHLLPYPPKGGVQQRSYNLLREVSRYHQVTLLAFNQKALLPAGEAVASAREALGEFLEVVAAHPIPADDVRGGRHLLAAYCLLARQPYTARWLTSTAYRETLEQLLASQQFDAVHFDTISLAQYAPALKGQVTTLNHHNIESDMLLRRAQLEGSVIQRRYYAQEGTLLQRYEATIASRFDLHLTCSALDGERLIEIAPSIKYEIVPNGVDLGYFTPRNELGGSIERSAIFAGGLSWYPNASAMRWFLEEIWPAITASTSGAQMTIIGRNAPEWLTKQAARLPGVRTTGFVPDVRPYMEEAEVYVCPIFDGGGTKLKMLDAMAMGKAIVAHPAACEGIDLQHELHVMIAQSADEFAQCVTRLWLDRPLRERLGRNARSLIEKSYSFHNIGRRLAELFSELGAREPVPRNR